MIDIELLINEFEEQIDIAALRKAANLSNIKILNIENQSGFEIRVRINSEKEENIFFFGQQYELCKQMNSNLMFFSKWSKANKNSFPLRKTSPKKILRAIKLSKRK